MDAGDFSFTRVPASLPPMTRRASLHRVPMAHPGDVSGVEALIEGGLNPSAIVAILGKTEGNGCVNDFTRAYAVAELGTMLAGRLGTTRAAVLDRVAMVMSGGTEGGLSPHFLVLSVAETEEAPTGALAIGTAFTPDFRPEISGPRRSAAWRKWRRRPPPCGRRCAAPGSAGRRRSTSSR